MGVLSTAEPFSLRSALRVASAAAPSAPALIHRFRPEQAEVRVISHAELDRQIDAAAAAFVAAGVRSDEAVAIVGASLPEYLAAFYGASEVAIAFPVNPLLTADAIAVQFAVARVRVCIVVGETAATGLDAKLAVALAANPQIAIVVHAGAESLPMLEPIGVDVLAWQNFLATGRPFVRERRPEDIAAMFHTGGTSGAPKLAQLSRRALAAGPAFAAERLGWRADDRALNLLPYFHVGGALATATSVLLSGAANVTVGALGARDPALLADLWTVVRELDVTVAGLVPTSWAGVAAHPLQRMFAPFRAMVTGASSMPATLRRRLETEVGAPFCEVYGMTEFAGFCSGQPLDGSIPEPGVGLTPTAVELKFQQPHGEVALRGPNIFSGYRTASGTVDDPAGGFVLTGDLGALDGRGQLVLRGRSKDVIVRSGHNIDPLAIEEVATAHACVRQAAAVGRPDAYAGEVPVLYITLIDGASVADLEEHLRQHIIEGPARPKAITVLPALPMTNVGKLNRNRLRQLATIEAASEALAANPPSLIECDDPAARELTLGWDLCPDRTAQLEVNAALEPLGLRWRDFVQEVKHAA